MRISNFKCRDVRNLDFHGTELHAPSPPLAAHKLLAVLKYDKG